MGKRSTPPLTAFGDFEPIPACDQVVVVLVEAKDPRNIGSVARAMSNLGFSRLRLVDPGNYDRVMAGGVACWGSGLLEGVETFGSLRDAVADTHDVVGFASDSGRHRTPQLLLHEWVESSPVVPPVEGAAPETTAIVFGSEENGLRREHYPLCSHLVRIPSESGNRSYNLAQSVLLVLYSLRMSFGNFVGEGRGEKPTSSQLETLATILLATARRAGFLGENSPEHMTDLLTNITRRGQLTTRELKILTGLFGTIDKALVRGIKISNAE